MNTVSRTERKKEQTRQRIVEVAVRLFLDQGIEASTMEQIAAAADVAKGTLYNYFPVKEAILGEYIRRAFRQKNPDRLRKLESLPDTRSRLTLMLSDLIGGVQAQPEIFEKYLIFQVQHILSLHKAEHERSGIERLAEEVLRLGQESGEIRSDLPLGILADQVEFVFVEAAKQYYLDPEQFDAGETIARCVDLFLNGVKQQQKGDLP